MVAALVSASVVRATRGVLWQRTSQGVRGVHRKWSDRGWEALATGGTFLTRFTRTWVTLMTTTTTHRCLEHSSRAADAADVIAALALLAPVSRRMCAFAWLSAWLCGSLM